METHCSSESLRTRQMRRQPCIRGQRMRVSDVLDLLAAGATYEEILRDYAFLDREDILATLAYAARQTDHIVLQST